MTNDHPSPGPTAGYYYLASPYSHPLAVERESRWIEAIRAQAWLFRQKINSYSPIVHWHPVATRYNLPTDAGTFKSANDVMILKSQGLLVLMIPGWEKSIGVQDEINVAGVHGLPVHRIKPDGDGYTLDLTRVLDFRGH
jgi:hypothetical protein